MRKQPDGAKVDAFKLQINLFPHIKKNQENFPLCDVNEKLLLLPIFLDLTNLEIPVKFYANKMLLLFFSAWKLLYIYQ